MIRLTVTLVATTALLGLTGCATPNAEQGYTVKTEKWSRNPRDKFYRIVKVPKTPPACDASKGACPK